MGSYVLVVATLLDGIVDVVDGCWYDEWSPERWFDENRERYDPGAVVKVVHLTKVCE